MRILTIVGARPQFIKAAPFSAVCRERHQEIMVHTGQHYDMNMSEIFFNELALPKPDYNLGVGSGNHGMQTGRMLERIEELLLIEKPDAVLVYGDTNSTLAGALAASKLHIPVFHVEAGLRSYNKLMAEEQNRILTDHISTLLFCPTQTAVDNLAREGITSGINSGDIMLDAVLRNYALSEQRFGNRVGLYALRIPSLQEKEFYLATIHRAENTDNACKLQEIFSAFEDLDKPVLLPIHPRTRKLIPKLNFHFSNVIFTEPVGYLHMLYLISQAYMVLTDSGGLQKEAYFLKTPCTTLRNQTEWVETLENGWNVLTSVDSESILRNATRTLDCLHCSQPSLFGNGHAANNIIQAIDQFFAGKIGP